MKKVLAIILAVLFMLPVCAIVLDYPQELDHQAAVERIQNAKTYWMENREGYPEDAPVARVIIDYLDLRNTGNLSFTQRLVIIN